uniref:Uncharacterized protein n=1 Tax=Glossina pallidipes TaxID=7398 RepID=A0A1B0AGH2_GLOPL
ITSLLLIKARFSKVSCIRKLYDLVNCRSETEQIVYIEYTVHIFSPFKMSYTHQNFILKLIFFKLQNGSACGDNLNAEFVQEIIKKYSIVAEKLHLPKRFQLAGSKRAQKVSLHQQIDLYSNWCKVNGCSRLFLRVLDELDIREEEKCIVNSSTSGNDMEAAVGALSSTLESGNASLLNGNDIREMSITSPKLDSSINLSINITNRSLDYLGEYEVLRKRKQMSKDILEDSTNWLCKKVDHYIQVDTFNCGVHICQFVQALFQSGDLTKVESPSEYRKIMKQKLMDFTDDLENICLHCGGICNDDSVKCEDCGRSIDNSCRSYHYNNSNEIRCVLCQSRGNI